MSRYRVGCAGMFALDQDFGINVYTSTYMDQDEAIVAAGTIVGGEVLDLVTGKWLGPTCQEEVDEAAARIAVRITNLPATTNPEGDPK